MEWISIVSSPEIHCMLNKVAVNLGNDRPIKEHDCTLSIKAKTEGCVTGKGKQ